MKYIKNFNAITREEDEDILLFEHCEEGNAKISLLNKTAYVIWELCDGNNSVEEIINLFSKKFKEQSFEKIKSEITDFIERMVVRNWLIELPEQKEEGSYDK